MSKVPALALTGGGAERFAAITPEGHEAVIHLTITDAHHLARAIVIIEATPGPHRPGVIPDSDRQDARGRECGFRPAPVACA